MKAHKLLSRCPMDSPLLHAERVRALRCRMEGLVHEIHAIGEKCASDNGSSDFWASLERWATTALLRTHRLGLRAQALAVDAARDGAVSEVRGCQCIMNSAVLMSEDLRAVLVEIRARASGGGSSGHCVRSHRLWLSFAAA